MDPWTEGNPKYPMSYQISRVDAMLASHARPLRSRARCRSAGQEVLAAGGGDLRDMRVA